MMTTADIKALWRSLPLSADNAMEAIDEQIDRNPAVWQTVAQYLSSADLDALPLGRNEIGEGAFANVQEYETRLQSKYELHRRYIDVQLLTRGEEIIYVAPVADALEPQGEFDEQNDFILYASARSPEQRRVSPESYQLLFPSDAHMPCMAIDGNPCPVRKVVVKIPFV